MTQVSLKMDVVDMVSLASSDDVEIKLEDIDFDSENCTEQSGKLFLKCEESDQIACEGLYESHSKQNFNFFGDEAIKGNNEDEPKFRYVCNTINESVEAININENVIKSDSESDPKNGIQIDPINHLDELTGKMNNKNGQINGKPDPENCTEQSGKLFLKCEESDKIACESLDESHSKQNFNFFGDEAIKGNNEDKPKFRYVCNTINESVEARNSNENVIKSDSESDPKNGIQIDPINHLDELTGKINNKNGQINGKPAQKTTVLLNKNLKDGENSTLNKNKYFSDPRVYDEEIRVFSKRKYECIHCKYPSTSRRHLKYHIKSSHRNYLASQPRRARMQCPYCSRITTSLDYHIYSFHTKSEDIDWFYCGHCDHKTKLKKLLENHIHAKHTDPSLYDLKECKECGKKFRMEIFLNNHMKRIHYPEKAKWFKCDYCPHNSFKKSDSRAHMSLHVIPEEGFKCSKCDFYGKTAREIIKHRVQHREWKQCHLCSFKCKHNNDLRLHLIHHQEKKTEKDLKYKCEKCNYKTYRGYNLTIHELNHKKPEELEMYRCYHCSFKAKRKDNLKTHIFKHDIYKNVLDCFICSFKTRSKYDLTRHVDTHSEEQRKEAELHLSTKRKGTNIEIKKDKEKNDRTKRVKKNNKNVNKSKNNATDIKEESKDRQEKFNMDEEL